MAYKAKTKATEVSVDTFLAALEPAARRQDAEAICALMGVVSGEPAKMWGPTIVSFGRYHYRYESGHEGEMSRMGFSPRKGAHVFYLGSFDEREDMLKRLGKYTTGKSCLYIKRLADVDRAVLEAMVRAAWGKGRMMGEVT